MGVVNELKDKRAVGEIDDVGRDRNGRLSSVITQIVLRKSCINWRITQWSHYIAEIPLTA
jgi:hypothetical protein